MKQEGAAINTKQTQYRYNQISQVHACYLKNTIIFAITECKSVF